MKVLYNGHGKGMNFDTFVYLVKDKIYMKSTDLISSVIDHMIAKSERRLAQIAAVKQAIISMRGTSMTAKNVHQYVAENFPYIKNFGGKTIANILKFDLHYTYGKPNVLYTAVDRNELER